MWRGMKGWKEEKKKRAEKPLKKSGKKKRRKTQVEENHRRKKQATQKRVASTPTKTKNTTQLERYITTQMRRIEAGAAVLEEQILQKICEAYHVDPRYFEGTVDLDEAVEKTDPEKRKKEIGARLRRARKDRKMTMEELSILSGFGPVSRFSTN